ncbi:MAG: tRNA threonylcarbamoyladenosine biosynthesis protein TsaB [Alphaproteobacteria bacterium MarineAlpha9_Bin4]|nr:tRNA (adenosine(37)-N6)-threonylcarbamoyltransferase complex dimerization subunit type 1 TsaB [Pelagibacterales bacterium]PPR26604.1 MAG: tRNA threonylcarbamoyladenosine biosynthesis protein TsaB [Alphaproteobacteria bacterium MarineAlpha9_Bin4]|tara:strand:- start:782 stop:1429 length:648 start_codon:yes stop_codon:yes gene_type:complete
MKYKNILTIETSLGRIFLSILRDNTFFSKLIDAPRSIEEDINKLLDDLINEAKIKFNDIDFILVSLGPGSFTGIRIGISAAKALSLSTGAKIIGYSNFDSILYQFLESKKNKNHKDIEVLIKGPGNQFYKKIFDSNNKNKDNQMITEKELKESNYKDKMIKVGNFLNTLKIKNYYLCIPGCLGIKSIIKKNEKNLESYEYKELEPIYIKEHYAKK